MNLSPRQREVLARLPSRWTVPSLAAVACLEPGPATRMAHEIVKRGGATARGSSFATSPGAFECQPKPEPKPRAPRACIGECGTWRWIGRGHVLADGPTADVIDGEGRRYRVRWRLILPAAVVPSNDPQTFGPTPGYPRAFQARARGSAASKGQIDALERQLDPTLLVLPSSSAADSAPVVFASATDGPFWVISGNGRTMALKRWMRSAPNRAKYSDTIAARWRWSPRLLDLLVRHPEAIVVRQVLADEAAAVQLAGASQTAATAEQTTLERATGRARSAGILSRADLAALGPFNWVEALNAGTVQRFAEANPKFWASALGRLDATRAPTVAADPEAAARYVLDLLAGALPEAVRAAGLGRHDAQAALLGALPALWTLEGDIAAEGADPTWSLWPHLAEARRWFERAGSKAIAAMLVEAADDDAQAGLFARPDAPVEGVAPLAVGLAVLLLRAGRRANPEEAAAELVARYVAAARKHAPNQAGLFGGADPGDPVDALARILRITIRRPNPGQPLVALRQHVKRLDEVARAYGLRAVLIRA